MIRMALASCLLLAGIFLIPACSGSDTSASPSTETASLERAIQPLAGTQEYIGTQACGQCHQQALSDWQGSDHDLSMQIPGSATVRGDFNSARFSQHGVDSRFERRDGRYYVTTDSPDGNLSEFEIRYTFGHFPLQQYLIEQPGGRLQALGIAWDSRPLAEGGQRWFHLYPDQELQPGQRLHWTGRDQNWNFMCAECHSTGVIKGYDEAEDRYSTRWAELNVGCESCHGPGLEHARWAQGSEAEQATDSERGLQVRFLERQDVEWRPVAATGNPVRMPQRETQIEIDSCGRCHGRATRLQDGPAFGQSLLNSHRPALLDPDQYDADGQMRGEVFNWGPFLQSRMYRAGVTCSDCHQPHSLALRAEGNAVCTQCHQANRFDTIAHHHHEAAGAGSQCVNCHMPTTTFMQVDARHDHSFRVPRPDLGARLGTRDACTDCHTGRDSSWAASRLEDWFPQSRHRGNHFATAFDAAGRGRPEAHEALLETIQDAGQAPIVRATALRLALPWLDRSLAEAARAALQQPEPLLRMAALEVLAETPSEFRTNTLLPALADPIRAVRLAAIAGLAELPEAELDAAQKRNFDQALEEYTAALRYNADRPDAMVTLGDLEQQRKQPLQAEASYRRALTLDPGFTVAALRLAELMRRRGNETGAEALLREQLARFPEVGALHHALGLSLVRQKRSDEALAPLHEAVRLESGEPRYAHVYATALSEHEQPEAARNVLMTALEQHPHHADLLLGAALAAARAGDLDKALELAQRLVADQPGDARAQQLLQWVQAEKSRR